MANEVFISYSRKDYEKVRRVKDEIDKAVGVNSWMDIDGIESGEQFKNVIISAITRHQIILFMKSVNSMNSVFALKEIEFAKIKGKKIILIDLDNSPMNDDFLFEFSNSDIIDYKSQIQKDKLFRDLQKWTNNKKDNETKNNAENRKNISEEEEDRMAAAWYADFFDVDEETAYKRIIEAKNLPPVTGFINRVKYFFENIFAILWLFVMAFGGLFFGAFAVFMIGYGLYLIFF